MKMKLQNQKMLSLFLVALIVFVGVGQSLLAVHAESNKTENITVTLEAGEGTFKDDNSKTKIIIIPKGQSITGAGKRVPEVNPPENKIFEGWYWRETDVPDISGIPMDSNDNIIAKYRTVSDLETVPPAEIEEISKAKENLKNSVEALKKLSEREIDIQNLTPESVVDYQLAVIEAKKVQMNIDSLLLNSDTTVEQLIEGTMTVEQCIKKLEIAKANLKDMEAPIPDISNAKKKLEDEITSLEKTLEEKINPFYYTPDSVVRYDKLAMAVRQELAKAKKVLAEENTTLNSLKLQWWNLSYAHNSLKKAKPIFLEEAEASESDKASLKAALQKLEAVVLKSEDTTRATADSLNAYTAAHKAGEEEIEKAKTILNDKNAKKITVAKLEQALFNARITLEKAKNELVFLKDSEIYKPLGKDVVITKGSTVQAENFIDNISELPKDTTITFADEAPVTNVEIDKKEIKILVKYPDNSKSEIISTLTVSADNTQIVPLEIANIDITDAKMEIVKDAKKSFKLIYKDVRNQVIEKNDIVIDVMDVLDPSGTSITPSSSKMEVLQDYDDLSLLDIIICDGNLEPGTYTIILAVNQSKKEYSLPMEFYITHENNDPKKDEPPLVPSQPIEKDITENTMQEEISSIPKNQMSKIEEKKDEEKKDTVKEEIKSNLSSPKTGDTTQILLLLGILLGGFVLLLVLLYNKKKFNR